MIERDWAAERFEEHRPRLRAIAHRILGSPSEADDAVQEAWLRFSRSDTSGVDSLGAWLTTVVSRVCLNMLQARTTHAQPVAGRPHPSRAPSRPSRTRVRGAARRLGRARAARRPRHADARRARRVRAARRLRDPLRGDRADRRPQRPCRPATRQPGPRACGGRTPALGLTRSVMPRWSTPSSPPRARATRRPAEGPGPRRRAPRRPARRRAGRAGGEARAGAGRHVLAPGPGRAAGAAGRGGGGRAGRRPAGRGSSTPSPLPKTASPRSTSSPIPTASGAWILVILEPARS